MTSNTDLLLDYELLDSGDGFRLERFGKNFIARPESIAIWKPVNPLSEWKFHAICHPDQRGRVQWEKKNGFIEPWIISLNKLKFELRFSLSKNVGIFPEQLSNWIWLDQMIRSSLKPLSILNLFAYTGAASLVMAHAGAKVCHVDASKSVVHWASENLRMSQLGSDKIRWMVEDCQKFLMREIKRKTPYDGVVLDPPAFGHGGKETLFKFENEISELLSLCKELLPKKPKLFLLNSYSMRYSSSVIANLVKDFYPDETIESGELELIQKNNQYSLPCSIYTRFKNSEDCE